MSEEEMLAQYGWHVGEIYRPWKNMVAFRIGKLVVASRVKIS